MVTRSKPGLTGSSHTLPFEKLAPLDFERLCLWLVRREGYSRAEHLGEAGSECGRDIVAWKGERRVVFQCKRVKTFSAEDARTEIRKIHALPADEQPHELVFVVSRTVSASTRIAARAAWGEEESCHFWSGSELDERVKRHSDLLREFFHLPPARKQPIFRHNLPFPSLGALFQGRDTTLTWVRETLSRAPARRAAAIAGKAVHGLGGVGKTRLAIEYAWQYATEYSAALFVGAESPSDLRRNLAALCARNVLDLPEQETAEEDIREAAVLHWLGEYAEWLLILDNVDSEDASAAVDRLIAHLHGGHVLLTGRLARWSAGIERIELDVLTEEAAAGFLLARTKGGRRATKEDAAQAVALARELGSLPLALEQAGAYISERRLTFAAYLDEWSSRHDQVLRCFDPRVSHYPASVATTWQTSFNQLSHPARRLLERLAWLGPEPIPESLLHIPVPDAVEQDFDFREALVELATFSLVTRAAEAPTFTVHRLVQDVTRRNMTADSANVSLTEALRWLNAAFSGAGDPQDVRTWPTLDPLAPHARAIVLFADTAGLAEPTAELMNNLGQLLDAKALFAEAEPLMRRALERAGELFGTDHLNVAVALNNLGQLLLATNRADEAEPMIRRVLEIDENTFGTEHPNVASSLMNLAMLLQETGRHAEAEPLLRRMLKIYQSSLQDQVTGADYSELLGDLEGLFDALENPNSGSKLEHLLLQGVTEAEKEFGEDHPSVAVALANLARVLQSMDRAAEAEPLLRRALDIDEKSFGADHPEVATDLCNLAELLKDTDRLTEAEPLLRRALKIVLELERRTGHEHPYRKGLSDNFRRLLLQIGKSHIEIEAIIKSLVSPPG